MNTTPTHARDDDAQQLLPQSVLAAAIPFLQPGMAAKPDDGFSNLPLPLSPTLLRNLGDRSYDKRKGAAMEVENLIKQLQEKAAAVETRQRVLRQQAAANGQLEPALLPNESRERIPLIIDLLGNEFAFSTNANHRKGGLIGLAATAIGLMHEAHLYLDKLLPPVLHCFDDPESRVRYYACESLYNIAKVARGNILQYFNKIFDGLCKVWLWGALVVWPTLTCGLSCGPPVRSSLQTWTWT